MHAEKLNLITCAWRRCVQQGDTMVLLGDVELEFCALHADATTFLEVQRLEVAVALSATDGSQEVSSGR